MESQGRVRTNRVGEIKKVLTISSKLFRTCTSNKRKLVKT